MRVSTKGRYAVTAIMDLYVHGLDGPVTLADISERQQLSLSYLEQLFARMRRHELVQGTRGPGGGYRLARPADSISVADVIIAVDEPVDATQCQGREDCDAGERCLTHDLWSELSGQLQDFLDDITLAELGEQPSLHQLFPDTDNPLNPPGAPGRA